MKSIIKKILKESDFEWIEEVPSEVPNDYEHSIHHVYEDDSGYGFMEDNQFMDEPNSSFDCRDYNECPKSVVDISLNYPYGTGGDIIFGFGDELIEEVKLGNDVGDEYIWIDGRFNKMK